MLTRTAACECNTKKIQRTSYPSAAAHSLPAALLAVGANDNNPDGFAFASLCSVLVHRRYAGLCKKRSKNNTTNLGRVRVERTEQSIEFSLVVIGRVVRLEVFLLPSLRLLLLEKAHRRAVPSPKWTLSSQGQAPSLRLCVLLLEAPDALSREWLLRWHTTERNSPDPGAPRVRDPPKSYDTNYFARRVPPSIPAPTQPSSAVGSQ